MCFVGLSRRNKRIKKQVFLKNLFNKITDLSIRLIKSLCRTTQKFFRSFRERFHIRGARRHLLL